MISGLQSGDQSIMDCCRGILFAAMHAYNEF